MNEKWIKKRETVVASVKSMEIRKIVEQEIFCDGDEKGPLYKHPFVASKVYVFDGKEAYALCPKHSCMISVTLQRKVNLGK